MKFGVLGAALIAHKVCKAILRSEKSQVVAIGSRSVEKAEKFAKENEIPKFYGSYEEVLLDSEVEAVYIPLPTSMCTEWAIKCAEAKKHVLCDKPFANAKEVQMILDACEKNGVHFMDNTMFVHHPRYAQITDPEFTSKLGTIKFVNASFSNKLTDLHNIRYNREFEPQGALGDLGWYCVKWILSFYNWKVPKKVFATAKYYNDDKNSVITALNAILWFNDDCMAHLDCSFELAMNQIAHVVGTEGTLIVDDFVLARNDVADFTVIANEKRTVTQVKECVQEMALINNFANKIEHCQVSYGKQTYLTQLVLDGIEKSVIENKVFEF